MNPQVWTFRTNKPVISSPTFGDDKIYIGSVDGSLYALDAASGKVITDLDCGPSVEASLVTSPSRGWKVTGNTCPAPARVHWRCGRAGSMPMR